MASELYGYFNSGYLYSLIYYNDDFYFFNWNVKAIHA